MVNSSKSLVQPGLRVLWADRDEDMTTLGHEGHSLYAMCMYVDVYAWALSRLEGWQLGYLLLDDLLLLLLLLLLLMKLEDGPDERRCSRGHLMMGLV